MKFEQFFFGGDYNPEQWPEETWLEDVNLMQTAGVNLVSLGIFSWAKLEPQPGIFDFEWLDRVMDLLHSHGVSVNLATPTAAPPAWMVRLHPQILPVTADGITLWHGSRRHYCPHNPDYRGYAQRIARVLAERYKNHPALAMWHVDNEYACHISECFCQHSVAAFREWLKLRYTSLDQLNFAWGTAFWGQAYGDWNEIQPPRRTPAQKNPTQQLDWTRFSSDSWLVCFEEQKRVFKEITPAIPVTTNFMSFHRPIDYFKFAQQEDVVSLDSYPDTSQPDWMIHSAMTYDLIRSLKKDSPWILMEQAASLVNWRQRNAVKRPGVMRLGSLQAVARGANGVMFFQWRQSKFGGEMFHSAMLPHAGTDSRTWREVSALGNELPRLSNLLSSKVEAKIAILMDWENWWALELDSKPSSDLKLIPNLQAFYRQLYERNIMVDFAPPEADLSSYKLVIAPNLYLVTGIAANNLNNYVANGGTLLLSYFSGIVDNNQHIHPGGYAAPFHEMLGLTIEEFVPYQAGFNNTIRTTDGKQFKNTFWADVVHLNSAETLANYEQDYYAGSPAVTRNTFKKGTAYYLGTELSQDGLEWLIDRILEQAQVWPDLPNLPAGIEVMLRSDQSKEWLFILNHTDKSIEVPTGKNGTDLLSGQEVSGVIHLSAYAAAVIEQERI
jgi:beta-galactosidase